MGLIVFYAGLTFLAWLAPQLIHAGVTAVAARRAGLIVERIWIGFGPKLFKGNLFGYPLSIGLLPLGSSVKFPFALDEPDFGHADVPLPLDKVVFEQFSLPRQLFICASGHAVVLVLGVLLLAVAVLAGAPQLMACAPADSVVQPCGMPGLCWSTEPTTAAGQVALFHETGLTYLRRLMLFQPLPQWGGFVAALATGGALGATSLLAWITAIGLLWSLLGVSNFLPLPGLAGFQLLQFPAERVCGSRPVQNVTSFLVLIALFYMLALWVRVIWLDLVWFGVL